MALAGGMRWLVVFGAVLLASEALALGMDDLVGEWRGNDNKTHRIKVQGFNTVILCRPVAEVAGGIRAYRGRFAQGGFELVSKPGNIGELNNRLPAALRRELIRRPFSVPSLSTATSTSWTSSRAWVVVSSDS